MPYSVAADIVVVLHLLFIVFAVLGGLLVLKWQKLIWLHVPAAIWGVLIEFAGWICPLTPLEKKLRAASGSNGYSGGFVEHYIIPIIYPAGLTREVQVILGLIVLVMNVVVYVVIIRRNRRRSV